MHKKLLQLILQKRKESGFSRLRVEFYAYITCVAVNLSGWEIRIPVRSVRHWKEVVLYPAESTAAASTLKP